MALCDFTTFADNWKDLIATQYRESPNLRALIQLLIDPAQEAGQAMCDLTLDIDTATGDQLTQIGKILGWPRVNCNGAREPVFGFDCGTACESVQWNIGGFCDVWSGDCDIAFGQYEFTDDDLYRRFLKALVYHYDRDYSRPTLVAAVQELWGAGAGILYEQVGLTGVFTGRALTADERSIIHLAAQVLPIPPGLDVAIYQTDAAPFGFGAGWGEFCTGEFPIRVH